MKRFLRWVLFYTIFAAGGDVVAAPAAPQFFIMARAGNTYTFAWSEVPGATRYLLSYMLLSDPSVIYRKNMGEAVELSVEITGAIRLYAAVHAADRNGIGEYSDILYLDTEQVENLPEASGIIGPAGGTVAVTNKISPGCGAGAVFPAGALGSNTVVGIRGTALPGILPDGMKEAGKPIDFSSTTENFGKPVRLVLPYNDLDDDGIVDDTGISELAVGAWYFNGALGRWEEKRVVARNRSANLVTIETDHFSTYLTLAGEDSLPEGTGEGFLDGEYFVGDRILGRNGCINERITINCGSPYFLTVRNKDDTYASGLTAVIDRHVTKVAGIPVTFSADMKSASFDATKVFDKIGQSGNADLWKWECDFVAEHTRLIDYVAVDEDDLNPPANAGGDKIFCNISVDPENLNRVIIDWGVDITNQLYWGNTLAVKFEATYVGVPEPL